MLSVPLVRRTVVFVYRAFTSTDPVINAETEAKAQKAAEKEEAKHLFTIMVSSSDRKEAVSCMAEI